MLSNNNKQHISKKHWCIHIQHEGYRFLCNVLTSHVKSFTINCTKRVGVPLTRLILPRLCACLKPDGIVDHHYVTASNKNVDIKFSGEDAFLEYYSNLNQKERSCVQKVYVKCVYVIFGASDDQQFHLAWDRHKGVAGLNGLMGHQLSSLDNGITTIRI
jgi:hypothetical protein